MSNVVMDLLAFSLGNCVSLPHQAQSQKRRAIIKSYRVMTKAENLSSGATNIHITIKSSG